MKTYLVTGSAGFIGANFVRNLIGRDDFNANIISLDALTYAGNLDNLAGTLSSSKYMNRALSDTAPGDSDNKGFHIFVKADICDKEAVQKVFRDYDIDTVVHFAAESHVDRSIEDPEVFIRTNVLGTAILLNAAKDAWADKNGGFTHGKRFLHVSTDEVYGSLGETGYFTENTPIAPRSPYSASKASSDLICLSYYDTFGFPVIVTRCSNNYGPYQFPEKLIPLMINNTLNHKPLPVYGDGKNVRDWLYVEDHAEALHTVCLNGKNGEVYNIGGNNEKYNIDIVKLIIKTVYELLPDNDPRKNGINEGLITYVKDRPGHDRRYAIDAGKISSELNWKPKTNFDDGIRRTVKWYLDNERWVSKITNGEYLEYYARMYNGGMN